MTYERRDDLWPFAYLAGLSQRLGYTWPDRVVCSSH